MLYPQSDTRPARIFISHAEEEKDFAKAIVSLLSAIGVDARNSIICTSESELGIKAGRDWGNELKSCFTDYRTVIEKFEKEGNDVGFAVVLLTADDKGRKNKAHTMQSRARQNVVFEMGYFMALLGRERVILLLQEGVEEPSDLKGIVYTKLDKDGAWKYRLVKELREQGYDVSSDSL